MFPTRVHMDRDTPSPEPLVHSFTYDCHSPQKRSPPTNGELHKVTVCGVPCRWKDYIQWNVVWVPNGIIDSAIPTPCHAALRKIPSTLARVDQSLISQGVS